MLGLTPERWVQAVHAGLKIIELPVPLIYLEEKRSFGGALDDATTRLEYYHDVLAQSLAAVRRDEGEPSSVMPCGKDTG